MLLADVQSLQVAAPLIFLTKGGGLILTTQHQTNYFFLVKRNKLCLTVYAL